ncbi:DUF2530 domain-containing protein [Pseudonocardia sp. NPDC046786]|uniref:DUF2530 domain-containing protein n=1 Tax=Pseudonocardia sp. NPDC046786 TaxID=3155471 RepID=UPI0034097F14
MTASHDGDPPPPPALPSRFYESPPVLIGGMAVWAIAAGIALCSGFVAGTGPGEVFWTCIAGLGVGLFGALVFSVQRAAARRGDRSAQRGVEPG